MDSNGDGIREWSDGNPLAFTLTCRNSTANIDSIANIIKSNMEAVGIGLTVSIVDPATYTDNVTQNMTFDMNYIEWGVIDDPDMALDAIYLSSATLNFMATRTMRLTPSCWKSRPLMILRSVRKRCLSSRSCS